MYNTSLFIFRRDLRLFDNTALIAACVSSKHVIPAFIFDPRQIGNENGFKSLAALQFMIHSLQELNRELVKQRTTLAIFYGKAHDIVAQLIQHVALDAIFVNRDYTPFSIARDAAIKKICVEHKKEFISHPDALLNKPEAIFSQSKTPYTLFTPFFKKAITIPVLPAQKLLRSQWYTNTIPNDQGIDFCTKILVSQQQSLLLQGGRKEALSILKNICSFKNYLQTHDYPSLPTTHLSAHLKFGTLSIREVYHTFIKELGYEHPLIRQLYWRDFFYHVAYHSPFVFGHAFQKKYDSLAWKNNEDDFRKWCDGLTGFPIVDAGMRELNKTGFMHNRVRMIVASFLTKDLHIDWRWGERYFAQKLIDYDPAVNNGNWQWAASTGSDAQPYFRIFNPWLQQKKFDAHCVYIKKWLPELSHLTPKQIHRLEKKEIKGLKYPRPMIDHAKESTLAKRMYKRS